MNRSVAITLCLLLVVAGVGSAGQYGKCAAAGSYDAVAGTETCCCSHEAGMHQACSCCAQTSELDEVMCDCNIGSPLLFVSAFQPVVSAHGALRADAVDRVEDSGTSRLPHSIKGSASIVEYGPIEVILRTCSFRS